MSLYDITFCLVVSTVDYTALVHTHMCSNPHPYCFLTVHSTTNKTALSLSEPEGSLYSLSPKLVAGSYPSQTYRQPSVLTLSRLSLF